MKAYHIEFTRKGSKIVERRLVDASEVKFAKRKIERSLRTTIKIVRVSVVGYY